MSTTSSAIERTVLAVAKAALNGSGPQSNGSEKSTPQHKSGLSTGKAILLGAGLMAAGQAVVKSRGRDALDSVRHSLAEKLDGDRREEDEEDLGDEEYEDEEFDDEPEAEAEEGFDEEEEPEGEAEEDFDDEGDLEEPEDVEEDDYEDEDEDYEEDEEDEEDEEPRRQPRRKAASGGRRR